MSGTNNNNQTPVVSDKPVNLFFRASAADFKKIPGSPIAYWVSENLLFSFNALKLKDVADAKQGMATSDNDRFLRLWFEVSSANTCFTCKSNSDSESREEKWYSYNKGGAFRRWYGNNEYIVNWYKNGYELKAFVEEINKLRPGGRLKNQEYYFLENITYSALSSGLFSARYNKPGFLFDTKGSCIFPLKMSLEHLISFLNSNVAQECLNILCPTLDYSSIGINALPIVGVDSGLYFNQLLEKAKIDWDAYEVSWDFSFNSMVCIAHNNFSNIPRNFKISPSFDLSIKKAYTQLRAHWQAMTLEMQRLEQENNRIFIDTYGLQDELTPDVPLNEITLTCNPHYRYGNNKTDAELEALLLADTLKEFISYAVGCMFGRYALDKPGLILANQGETLADYLKQIPEPIFSVDDDNVIPMLDGDWFTDDVTERFGKFLKVTFGEAHYEENLNYIEQALGKDIRKYFLKDFYNDHLKRYKKRPIYWLFSSPKGTFNALIYLHRYRSDTVSVVLNDYLREFRAKLSAHKVHLEAVSISGSASASEKTKALKDIENHRKMLDELDTYEREVLYPLATEQLEIDLDDGVKVNYQKFGEALKKIPGLAAKED